MRPGFAVVGLATMLAVTACDQATAVPAGAQIVHVVITDDSVSLDPATARAGDLYLVLDAPRAGQLTFVASSDSATATPGPLTEAEVQQVRDGNVYHTAITGFGAGGCTEAQDAAARGKTGPCGNAFRVTVAPGSYLVTGDSPERDPATGRVPPMAVLKVTP
jgi:hypothetical protein